jgi:putative transposase
MGTAYRSLVLRYDLLRLPPEVAGKVSALLKAQEEFRQWATEWAKSGGFLPPPDYNPLKYFAKTFLHGGRILDWLKKNVKAKKMRPPLVFDAQLRLSREKDIGRGVFIDMSKREVRIRKWGGGTLALPLAQKATEWILARVQEGGRLALAAVWVGPSKRSRDAKLHVALVFKREVAPMRPRRLLVIDFNALHNGIAWAVIEERKMVIKGVLRPNVSKILHLQKIASKLDSLCAEKDEACGEASVTKSYVWRLLRVWEGEAVKKLVRLALQYKTAIIVDVPEDSSIRELKEGIYASERKIFLNFGRIRKGLRGLSEWYGIQYREGRLYSTVCPRCGGKMEELPNRRVRCAACSFEAHRDEAPFHWAMKLFPKLISFSSSPFHGRPAAGAALPLRPAHPARTAARREPAAGRGSQPADARRRLLCGRVKPLAGSPSAEFI